jgi:hypothetical protein
MQHVQAMSKNNTKITFSERSFDGTKTMFTVQGFDDLDQASQWASEWSYENYGYSPFYTMQVENGVVKVYCKLYNSCD